MSDPDFHLQITSARDLPLCDLFGVFIGVLDDCGLFLDRPSGVGVDSVLCKYVERTIGEYESYNAQEIRQASWQQGQSRIIVYFCLSGLNHDHENQLCSIEFEKGNEGWSVIIELNGAIDNLQDFIREAEGKVVGSEWNNLLAPLSYVFFDSSASKEKELISFYGEGCEVYLDIWPWAIFWTFWMRFNSVAIGGSCNMNWRESMRPVWVRAASKCSARGL